MGLSTTLEEYLIPIDRNKCQFCCYLIKIPTINSEIEKIFLKYLSPAEKTKSQELIAPKIKFQYIFSRATLRKILKFYLGVDAKIEHERYGKPYLLNGSLHFNLAHSNRWLAVALSCNHAVGVDIEEILEVPEIDQMEGLYSFEEDCKSSFKENKLINFYFSWTKRESIAKALGVGIGAKNLDLLNFKAPTNVSVRQTCIDDSYVLATTVLTKDFEFTTQIIRIESFMETILI